MHMSEKSGSAWSKGASKDIAQYKVESCRQLKTPQDCLPAAAMQFGTDGQRTASAPVRVIILFLTSITHTFMLTKFWQGGSA